MLKSLSISSATVPAFGRYPRPDKHHGRWDLPEMNTEMLVIASSLFFSVFCNGPFWLAIMHGRDLSSASTWFFAGTVFAIVTALHCLLLGLVVTRRTAKPLLMTLFVVTGMAVYYMQRYKVFFDASMVRNVLHTDVKEARELLSFSLFVNVVLYGLLPSLLLMPVKLVRRPAGAALLARAALIVGSLVVVVCGIALAFQDLSASMRNDKAMRYLITPGNYLISSASVLGSESQAAGAVRKPVGSDARLAASWANRPKPALLVIVVGETVRAANWGMNGYARQTTPNLAALDVVNFRHVSACGTNTEASLPCMFSPFGRKDYDEKKIRQHESLLNVLDRSGIKTIWRDNQSGCKGVCDGVELQQISGNLKNQFCDGNRCFDEVLLENLDAELKSNRNLVLVLHQLGNHGPAYFQRYPAAFRQFTPTCDTADLGKCTRQQIVNSYDNALLYTDHFLSKTIQKLQAQTTHDAAMIYVSDHGESLGEKGFYLHGLPYVIAPKEQTEVPMVMWLSGGFASSFGIDTACLRQTMQKPISHDYLFHSILGMLQVSTTVYDKDYDVFSGCRT